jgi:hypothetical protein
MTIPLFTNVLGIIGVHVDFNPIEETSTIMELCLHSNTNDSFKYPTSIFNYQDAKSSKTTQDLTMIMLS